MNLSEFNFDDYLNQLEKIERVKVEYTCLACKDSGIEILADGVRSCRCQVKQPKKHPLSFCFETDPIVFDSAISILEKTVKLTREQMDVIKSVQGFFADTTKKAPYLYSKRVGTGKTAIVSYLGLRIAQERNLRTQFLSTVRLKELLLSCFDSGKPVESVLNELKYSVDFLILDDLGAEKLTEFYEENLYNLIDYRYNARKATAFTSNMLIDNLPYSPRLRSRIHGLSVEIELNGKDFRRD